VKEAPVPQNDPLADESAEETSAEQAVQVKEEPDSQVDVEENSPNETQEESDDEKPLVRKRIQIVFSLCFVNKKFR